MAFLNEDENKEEHYDINFKLDSSSSRESSEIEEKNYSKSTTYASLYDLFNQRFTLIKNQKYTEISLG